ncbi:MAG: glucose-6-phosphate isomerase, partial [Rectinema sp.]
MVNFKELDACDSFAALKKASIIRLHDLVTPTRIADLWIPHAAGLSYCYAFAPVDDLIVERLQALADEQQLIEKYHMLVDGAFMNTGEGRMVLHHLARGRLGAPVTWKRQDMEAFYREEKLRFYEFAEKVRGSRIRSSAGKPFAQVVQVGIGGSDLGPRAASIALSRWATAQKRAKLTPWFISNVDPDDA